MRARIDRLPVNGALLLCAVLCGAANAVAAHAADCSSDPADIAQLVHVDGPKVVYAPRARILGAYRRILLDPIEIAISGNQEAAATQPTQAENARTRSKLAAQVHSEFAKDIGGHYGYPFVSASGCDVLRIHARLVRMSIGTSAISAASRAGSEGISSSGMTLIVELYDSKTNRLIARLADHEVDADAERRTVADRGTDFASISRAVDVWTRLLRWGLDDASSPTNATETLG